MSCSSQDFSDPDKFFGGTRYSAMERVESMLALGLSLITNKYNSMLSNSITKITRETIQAIIVRQPQ